jgi:hypothetical protein
MLALDRRIFDTPLEERLRARTSDLVTWTTSMFHFTGQNNKTEAKTEQDTMVNTSS